ncbi:WD repeat-containing and planar cell polarity effector protein fritz homolog isoform X4 [Montipora capricornis]|uniref:WD repeat-containing and planar cell polarity effector protein fritz homolog isoform X4 n=1 Tax=Montipora capricornis TaxID=246305 RepID=UPI0035F1E2EA
MASLLGHLHFCSLKKCATSTGSNIGTHVYHEKTSGTGSIVEEPYSEQRRLWGEDRGVSWTPRNRRPEKLRDCLKELEDILQSCIVLDARWRTLRNIQGELVSSLHVFWPWAGINCGMDLDGHWTLNHQLKVFLKIVYCRISLYDTCSICIACS